MENAQNERSAVGWVVTVIILAAIGMGIYYLFNLGADTQNTNNTENSDYYVSIIQVKHQYKDGKHIYVGALDLPTPCYRLDAAITLSNDKNVISITTPENQDEACAQVVTTRNFRVEIDGPAGMTAEGFLNGRAVQLNIFEVPAGEDIDSAGFDTKG